ncbi:MAG: phage major capsid protein [Propionibacteriales bacterium]|jgi:HK97 family phage major capsid protein|nr:phage major capsid protein [Propionibacteriales bacterium]
MPSIREILSRRAEIRTELRGIIDRSPDGVMSDDDRARADGIEAEAERLNDQERRQATLDALTLRTAGEPLTAERREQADVGLMDVVRAGMGATDRSAGLAKEMSAEMERRSGRKAEGIYWNTNQVEQRVVTPGLPVAGPGSNIIGTDFRSDLFIDRLRAATRVRQLGATVLSGLTGNVSIPRLKADVPIAWVADNSPLIVGDPAFDSVTLSPRHAGVITEWSRSMSLQSSPDIEAIARNSMAKMLGQVLDSASIHGTGTNNMPTGILATPGIGSVAVGANGGPLTYNLIADLVGGVSDLNADDGSMAFLTNSKVRRALSKLVETTGAPLGLPVLFQNGTVAYSNLVASTGVKGTGTGLSALIYGNWSDLLIGMWSELDILVNPYESVAYSKENVSIRAMMTVDIAVRHPESFAAITDIVA